MYILNQLGQANTSYNVPAVLLLEGEVDKDRLENAIQQLINRHEILRTSFDLIDGEVVQTVHKTYRSSWRLPRDGKNTRRK